MISKGQHLPTSSDLDLCYHTKKSRVCDKILFLLKHRRECHVGVLIYYGLALGVCDCIVQLGGWVKTWESAHACEILRWL